MEPTKKKLSLDSSSSYFNTSGHINLDREIRKHIEKTEIILKKEENKRIKKG